MKEKDKCYLCKRIIKENKDAYYFNGYMLRKVHKSCLPKPKITNLTEHKKILNGE